MTSSKKFKLREEADPTRDLITKLQQEGRMFVKMTAVRMLGGPLDGQEWNIDVAGTELELIDPSDAHNAVREGRAPKLLGLYMRFGTMMIWQREHDDGETWGRPPTRSAD